MSGGGLSEPAPAKINLALHVTGRRPDGYHELDTLAVFATIGDTLSGEPATRLSLAVEGPFAAALAEAGAADDNLILRAARALRRDGGARLDLDKRLPVGGGIGGGSADAAAALRLLARLWRTGSTDAELAAIGARLGADVPMCLIARPLRATGVGERTSPLPGLPPLDLVLVNPGVPVSTAAVFRRLARIDGSPLPPLPARVADSHDLAAWLAGTRNDLEAPARLVAPEIGLALDAIAATHAGFVRMSGSGSTCFGLYPDATAASAAAAKIAAGHPGWWVVATTTGGS